MKNPLVNLTPEQSRRNSTAVVRAQLAILAKGNIQKVQEWLDRTADGDLVHGVLPDPARALDLFLRMLEFSVPKLSRAEVAVTDTSKDGVAHLTIADLQALLKEAQTFEGKCEVVPANPAALTAE